MRAKFPKLAVLLCEAEDDVLAFMSPVKRWSSPIEAAPHVGQRKDTISEERWQRIGFSHGRRQDEVQVAFGWSALTRLGHT